MVELTTNMYDQADQALDRLEFVTGAVAAMATGYSDNVVNGAVVTMMDATDELRTYMEMARDAMLKARAATAEPCHATADGSASPWATDYVDAVDRLTTCAHGVAHVLQGMASATHSGEGEGAAFAMLAESLDTALADVELAADAAGVHDVR